MSAEDKHGSRLPRVRSTNSESQRGAPGLFHGWRHGAASQREHEAAGGPRSGERVSPAGVQASPWPWGASAVGSTAHPTPAGPQCILVTSAKTVPNKATFCGCRWVWGTALHPDTCVEDSDDRGAPGGSRQQVAVWPGSTDATSGSRPPVRAEGLGGDGAFAVKREAGSPIPRSGAPSSLLRGCCNRGDQNSWLSRNIRSCGAGCLTRGRQD